MELKPKSDIVEYVKFSGVIGLILAIATVLYFINNGGSPSIYLRFLMGASFLIFGTFKLVGYKYFVAMFPMYDILAKKINSYAYTYPFIELLFSGLYFFNLTGSYKDIAAFLFTGFGVFGIYKNLKSEGKIKCACLGNIIKLPLSKVSLFENLAMGVMAVAMLAQR